jgi:hypothetical protein
VVASFLPFRLDGAAAYAVWAAVWAVAGYVAIWSGFFIGHLLSYRSSGFRDHDWLARHDDSDPSGAVFFELVRTLGRNPNLGVDLELWVKCHAKWEVVDGDKLVLMPDKVFRCRFDLGHELFPGGFYEVRWFRADDRGNFFEITRERFQLRNHSIGPRRGSVLRATQRLAPKAVPVSQDEIKPRRLAPGTSAGWHSGCRCVECRRAHSDTQRAWGRARAQERLPDDVRRQLLDAIHDRTPFRQALRDLDLTPNQVWGLTRTDDEWSTTLQTTSSGRACGLPRRTPCSRLAASASRYVAR